MVISGTLAVAVGLLSSVAVAATDDFEFELEGYYRQRFYVHKHMFVDQNPAQDSFKLGRVWDGEEGDGRFISQRLRLQPELDFEGRAQFAMMADVLDNVVWGDNQSVASTPLFAGNPTSTGMDGTEEDTFQIKRAWMSFKVPVGLLKVGRQPSNWGMGLLANHGDGFDDLFGENHYGSTYDRIIFATRPIAIGQAIAGREDSGVPLFMAIGVDRLVEDPLDEYYGYNCTLGLVEGVDAGYDPRCDSDGNGATDQDHSYVDERTDEQRKDDWWVDQEDDVMEMIYVLIYKGEGLQFGGSAADLTAGVYLVNRVQRETMSNVLIQDAYLRFLWNGIYAEGEILHIGGMTDAIALPGADDSAGSAGAPLHKEANIWGWVGRAGLQREALSAIFEAGFASGDDDPLDVNFTGRPLHPDYNVGLLLYEEIMARVTAHNWQTADGLWSRGGVYNSRYIYPHVKFRPMENWELIAAYLRAWPDKPDGVNISCAESAECAGEATADHLGWELDFGLKHRFHNHMLFSLETAVARVTDRVPLENVGLNPDGEFFTVQSRLAYEF